MIRRAGRLASAVLLTASMTLMGGMSLAPTVTNVSASPLDKMDTRLRAHVSGPAEEAFAPQRAAAPAGNNYYPRPDDGCPNSIGGNVKVNQNCLNVTDADLQGRGQAQNETSIAVDPNNPKHILASYNDYRRGDGTCGVSHSLDGGASWADTTTPNGFTRGVDPNIHPTDFGTARQYWQAGGDTSVAWDSRGNAYLSCQVFMRGSPTTSNPDLSSGFLVFRSTKNNGGSFNFPGRYVTATNDVAGSGAILEDKQLLTVDNNPTSPFRDRVYITWTHFTATTGYIYSAYSSDYGETFSQPQLVSPAGSQVHCPASLTTNGGCDNNQFSQPFTAPDGTLYVVYSNYNTSSSAHTARYQVLIQKSTDGGKTFDAPHKVTDYYELPDCPTYQGGQDPGRACVPEKGSSQKSVFRASQYPVGAVNPDSPNRVVVSIGSYINSDSNEGNGCKPTGVVALSQGGLYDGVKTAGACANHILVSTSLNNGVTFNGASTDPRQMPLAMTPSQAHTDQFWQWLAFSNHKLAVAELDRQYGSDETNGGTDQTVLGSTSGAGFGGVRATTSSMPPPTQFGGVFWGDYSGLSASGDTAYPLWSDTRDADLFVCPGSSPPRLCGLQTPLGPANDEDVFTTGVAIPAGQ
jgi:hypothetical protein